jgi:uncharacterized protein YegL
MLLLGEEVTVTLTLRPVCPVDDSPLHIVLVLDGSSSMTGEPNREMKKAARQLIDRLNMQDNPATQVGVVQFNSAAKILCQLTNRSGQANGCIGRVGAAGGTNIGEGINAGLRVLQKGRTGFDDPDSIREIMVVLSDGEDNQGCGNVQAAAGRVKSQGILLITVCVGTSCDAQCMRQGATSPRYFFEASSAAQLANVFEQIRRLVIARVDASLSITGTVSPDHELVAGSGAPAPDMVAPDGSALHWRFDRPPTTGVTVSWRVRPLELGQLDLGISTFGFGPLGGPPSLLGDFDEPQVLVLSPRPIETATRMSGPPTSTSTPQPPPVTATVTPSPTPDRSEGLFLPLAVRDVAWR